jgi:molybdopterin synthase catalytic subunit
MRRKRCSLHEGEIVLLAWLLRTSAGASRRYDWHVQIPSDGDDWLGLTDSVLPIGDAYDWAVRPDCGAIVLFSGTVRDHADGRRDVEHLTYEAYEEQVVPRLEALAAETRVRWPEVGRIVLLHRTGQLELGESSVVAVVSAPHRPEAFAAARFAIDALKATVPIWKHEVWAGGGEWGTGASELSEVSSVPSPTGSD